jgi:hypothetical protein
MHALCQAMAIGLQTMSQTWLHNSLTPLYLSQQSMHIRHDFIVNLSKVSSNYASE